MDWNDCFFTWIGMIVFLHGLEWVFSGMFLDEKCFGAQVRGSWVSKAAPWTISKLLFRDQGYLEPPPLLILFFPPFPLPSHLGTTGPYCPR